MSYPAIRKLIAERDLQQLFDDQPHSPARSVIVQDRSEPDPALDDEAIFNELVATQDATPFEEKTQPQASAAEPAIPMDDAAPFGQPTAPQPGAAHRQPAAAVAFVPGASESTSPTEITVTFNSRQGKQVIVIPKPSPWLLQILSGQAPNTGRGVATAQNVSLRPVSSRAVTGSAMRRGTPLPPAQW